MPTSQKKTGIQVETTQWCATSSSIPEDLTLRVVFDIKKDFESTQAMFVPVVFVEDLGTQGFVLQVEAGLPTCQRLGLFVIDGRLGLNDSNDQEEVWIC